MIRCPSCGTFNPDSQLACRNCGSALPQTKRRCPECGTLNPVGSLFCDRCNARLVETEDIVPSESPDALEDSHGTAAVKGISLPTRPAPIEDTPAPPTDLPDWLSGLVDEDTEFGLSESTDLEPEDNDTGLSFESTTLPDWLGVGDGSAETTPIADDITEPSVPDWLSEMAAEPGSLPEAVPVAEELPDWLNEISSSLSAEEDEPSPSSDLEQADEDEDSGSDWMPGETATEETEGVQETESLIFSESELPDWLGQAQALNREEAGLVTDSANAVVAADVGLDEPSSVSDDTEEGLPDWLSEIADEDSSETQLPEWLAALSEAPPEPAVEEPAQAGPEAADETPAQMDRAQSTPSWLAGLDPSLFTAEEPAIFAEEDEEFDATEAGSTEGPSWLEDLAPLEGASELRPAAPVFFDQDLPEEEEAMASELLPEELVQVPAWLQDLDLSAAQSEPSQIPGAEEGTLARAELPAWLQELAPPEAAGHGVHAEVPAPSGGLTPAEIPDWVQALRAEPSEEGQRPREHRILPTPAEPEGPLEGLPGILPSVSMVDMPLDAKLSGVSRVPEATVAQAQLWQRLLEQPRSSQRAVWQEHPRRASNAGIVQGLIAVVLILGLFAAFWLIPEGMQLSQTSASQTAPGVSALVEGLDRLEPGNRVILAIEYSPAYADEMSQIAAPILEHLNAREVEIIAVSTLPEGTGLADALYTQIQRPLPLEGGGYLSGNANGIAEFLTRQEATSAQHLVILTSDPQRLRWWVEQNTLTNGTNPLPISVGASASAGPVITPYLTTSSIRGWLTGFPQALAYHEMRESGNITSYARVLDVLMLAHWIVIALLLVAFLHSLTDRKGAS